MSPVIRQARPDDAGDLSLLIQRSVRVLNANDYEPRLIDLICENFSPAKVLAKMRERDVFVCHLGNRAAGTISLGGRRLHSLFVDPDLKRNGIGTRLVAHLEAHAPDKGIRELELSSSITAQQFYLGRGYKQITFEERPDGSTYLMRKSLTPP